jgi:hypothetical protein
VENVLMDASAVRPIEVSETILSGSCRAVGGLWWMWLLFGVFWLVVAYVVLQFDQASVKTVGVLIGFMFIAAALQQLVIAVFATGWARWVLVGFAVLSGSPRCSRS